MKYVPEPWGVYPLDSRIIVDAKGSVIADVRVPMSAGCHEVATKMAAAPELLAACKMIAAMAVSWQPLTPGDIARG